MINWENDLPSYFTENGKIKQIIPGYVYREEQVSLSSNIAKAFREAEFLIAEAGTGIGKSYAYLIPAILWSVYERDKVVVATKTKALQQQIIEKDLPALMEVLGLEFTYAEAKGRENFLCWNKYTQIIAGKIRLEKEEIELVEKVMLWAEQTLTGDRKEIMLENRLLKNWGILSADRQNCLKDACPHQEKCFRLKMIKKLNKADLIITNHSLLLSDIMLENKILPEYEYLIIDEAHSFDREAFDKLSVSFFFADLKDILTRLYIKDSRWEKGYLTFLKRSFPVLNMLIGEIEMIVDRAIQLTDKMNSWFNQVFAVKEDISFSKVLETEEKNLFFDENFFSLYLEWHDLLHMLLYKMEHLRDELIEDYELMELDILIQNLKNELDKIFILFEEDIELSDRIMWIDFRLGEVISVSSSSVCIGDILYEKLYKKLKSLVMVSATLAVEGDFSYFLSKNGLNFIEDEKRLFTLIEKSPFMYEKQAFMYILEDMPMPDDTRFNLELAGVILEILNFLPGRILILFTSRWQMKKAAEILRPVCQTKGVKLLVQNEDGESAAVVNEYINSSNAVLMGLDTFWEGIDLKGDLLKCLIITKLPFRSPDEPFAKASSLYFSLQGKNTFNSFMLPDAVIRFKQGVGRLIRSEQDRGIIIVLDSRIEKKPYGKAFKSNIPIINIEKIKKEHLKNVLHAQSQFLMNFCEK